MGYKDSKKCTKCGKEKLLTAFRYRNDTKKHETMCKKCCSEYDKEYNKKNKERRKEYNEKNKDKIKLRNKEYYQNNKEKLKENQKQSKKNNKEKSRQIQKKYRRKNKEKINKSRRDKYNNNITCRLNNNMSGAIYSSLKSQNVSKNRRHWEDLVGYTIQELKAHLESLFLPGMTWENYGKYGWHIDHIIAKSFFIFTSTDNVEFKYCWSLPNLQPLWAPDNLEKGNKIISYDQGH